MAAERKPAMQENEQPKGMLPLAQRVQRTHLAVVPGATDPLPQPFPAAVLWWLAGGVLGGGLAGLLLGAALFWGPLGIPGWEGLYSMGPFTFRVVWTVVGVATGMALIGVTGILVANPRSPGPPAHSRD